MSDDLVTPSHKPEPVSLVPDKAGLGALNVSAITILTLLTILAGDQLRGLLNAPFSDAKLAQLSLVVLVTSLIVLVTFVWLARRLSIPNRIELKDDKVCIYRRYKYTYIDLPDIVSVRRASMLETLTGALSPSSVVITTKSGHNYCIPTSDLKNPAESRAALTDFLRPRLKDLASKPPTVLRPRPKKEFVAPTATFFMGVGLVFAYVDGWATHQINYVIPISTWTLGAIVGVLLFQRRIDFLLEGIKLREGRERGWIQFSSIKTIEFKGKALVLHNGSYEPVLTIRNVGYTPLAEFSYDLPDFPRIRDFIILHCPDADIFGNPTDRGLDLYAFDVPLEDVHKEHTPEPNHPLPQSNSPKTEVHQTNQHVGESR